MRIFRGPRWEAGAFVEGWIGVEAGRIAAVGSGAPPQAADVVGVLVPSLVNAHTHLADRVARGRIPEGISLEALVAPPHGLKHKLLAEASPAALRDAMRDAFREARDAGTRVVYDFREGGAEGARAMRDAARGTGVEPLVLGRPADAVDACDGLGLSAIRDAPHEARAYRDAARRAGKRFAVHWSEGAREDVDALLELAPDFAVHAVRATKSDLDALAQARVPLVACPRSNARLVGALPDVRAWLDAGVDACLGSDNAMLQTASLLDELRFARDALRGVSAEELVGMAVDAPRRRLAPPGAMRAWREGEPADFVALAPRGASALAALFAPDARVLAWGVSPTG